MFRMFSARHSYLFCGKMTEDEMSEDNVESGLKDHTVWKTIQSYALQDEKQSHLAFLVYMDLCEGKGWWNMKTHVNEDLALVYLSGHASRSKPREIILPVSSDTELSPLLIQQYLQKLTVEGSDTKELVLAVCGSDSGTVYYRLKDGPVLPESPEMAEWKRYRREERPRLQREHICQQRDLYVKQNST